jgi:hypothetical protein
MTVHWPPVLEVSAFPAILLSLFHTEASRRSASTRHLGTFLVPNQKETGGNRFCVSANFLLTRHTWQREQRDPVQISGFSPRIGEIHGSQLKENKSAPHFLKIVRFRAFVGNP